MRILDPYPSKFAEMYEVSTLAGRANIDVEELIHPLK
jgi:hypothetical protein